MLRTLLASMALIAGSTLLPVAKASAANCDKLTDHWAGYHVIRPDADSCAAGWTAPSTDVGRAPFLTTQGHGPTY
jgi:hypothetical protein